MCKLTEPHTRTHTHRQRLIHARGAPTSLIAERTTEWIERMPASLSCQTLKTSTMLYSLYSFTLVPLPVCLSCLFQCWHTNSCLMCMGAFCSSRNLILFRFSFRLYANTQFCSIIFIFAATKCTASVARTHPSLRFLSISLRHLLGIPR